MTTLAPPLARRTTRLLPSTLTVTRRALLRYLRTPRLIVLGTLQMAGFMLAYRYVFGGAIDTGRIPYVDFLVPGFVTNGVLFMGIGAAVAMAEDLEQGFVDRLRSLPIPRSSVLTARAVADTAILAWCLGVTVAIGFAVGSRLHGTVLDGLAAFGLVVLFGFVLSGCSSLSGCSPARPRRRRRWASWCSRSPSCSGRRRSSPWRCRSGSRVTGAAERRRAGAAHPIQRLKSLRHRAKRHS